MLTNLKWLWTFAWPERYCPLKFNQKRKLSAQLPPNFFGQANKQHQKQQLQLSVGEGQRQRQGQSEALKQERDGDAIREAG